MKKLLELYKTKYLLIDPVAFNAVQKIEASAEDYKAALESKPQKRDKYIGLLDLTGPIDYKDSMFLYVFGGTAVQTFKHRLQTLVNDPDVDAIIVRIDSPGGGVTGIEELAAYIREAREEKMIYMFADSMAASAAYWIGSQGSEFSVIPSGEVGSIGVYTMHVDQSKALEEDGIKVTLIQAGDYKTEGNPYQPLSEDAEGYTQYQVDKIYERFLEDVALGRQVGVEEVKESFGKGRLVMAKDAQKLGMVDHIESLEELVSRVISRKQNDTFKVAKAKAKLF